MKKILFFLLFASSLFSFTGGECVDTGNGFYEVGTLQVSKSSIGKDFACSPNSLIFYPDSTTQIYTCSSYTGPVNNIYTLYDYRVYSVGASCSPPPVCPDGQIQDADGVCVDIALPADFPTTDAKGTPSIRSDNTPESDCIPGTIHYTGIAYAQIIGWNSNTNKCEWGAFFCDSGLTWNNVSRTCEVPNSTVDFAPDDNASLTNSQTVSPELASACTSGKWAKSWTFDYCSTPAPCYIGLDAQGYNLQCGSKYIEYDCTSDYRVKKFLQVSCGDIAKSDFDKKDMEITSTTDKVPDTSSDSTNTDIADVINAGTNKTNDLLQELTNSNSDIKNSLDSLKDSLSASDFDTNDKLEQINNSLNPDTEEDNNALSLNDSNFYDFIDSVQESINTLKSNFDETKTFIDSGFTYSFPNSSCVNPSVVFYGKNVTFPICDSLSRIRPITYFIMTVSLIFLAIKIFIIGFMI